MVKSQTCSMGCPQKERGAEAPPTVVTGAASYLIMPSSLRAPIRATRASAITAAMPPMPVTTSVTDTAETIASILKPHLIIERTDRKHQPANQQEPTITNPAMNAAATWTGSSTSRLNGSGTGTSVQTPEHRGAPSDAMVTAPSQRITPELIERTP